MISIPRTSPRLLIFLTTVSFAFGASNTVNLCALAIVASPNNTVERASKETRVGLYKRIAIGSSLNPAITKMVTVPSRVCTPRRRNCSSGGQTSPLYIEGHDFAVIGVTF